MKDPENGFPYMAPHELLKFKPFRQRFVSKKHTENSADFFVKRGWLLITASGTVGVPIIATSNVEPFFLSHDLIRIPPKEDAPVGYLYAWIASAIAQPLFLREKYGGTIKHLEAHQIVDLPVPMLSTEQIRRIDQKIRRAWDLREEATQLEEAAIAELEEQVREHMEETE